MSQRNNREPTDAPGATGTTAAPDTGWEAQYQGVDALVKAAIDQVRQGLATLKQIMVSSSGGPVDSAQAADLTGQWFADVPALARAAADALTTAGPLFVGLPFDAAGLRAKEEIVRVVGEFLTFLGQFSQEMQGLYNGERKTLCEWTYTITGQLQGLQSLPILPSEKKALVDEVEPLVGSILDARKGAVQAVKKTKMQLRVDGQATTAAVQAKLDAKQNEVSVLRGGSMPVESPPVAAPKATRRTRR